MAFKITLTNKNNLSIELGGLNSPYTLYDVTGFNPPTATINTTKTALIDGVRYNSAKAEARTINIAIAIEYNAEVNRLYAYKVLRIKEPITLIYESDNRNVTIKGYIQSIDVTYMNVKQVLTFQMLCPFPYFKSVDEILNEINIVVSSFKFPFGITAENPIPLSYLQLKPNVEVINDGEVATGAIIKFNASGNVSNPKVLNYDTGEYIGVNFDMQEGDEITINTNLGERSVTLRRKGVTTNIFNSLMNGVTWLMLETGVNTFVYEAEAGTDTLIITIAHNDLYEGV